MENVDIFSETYDTVVSLGSLCQVAKQLSLNNIYNTVSPFDWITTYSTANVIQQFNDNFSGLFIPKNLQFEPIQDDHAHTFYITDISNGFRSLHDISKKNTPDKPFDELYKKFQHKARSLIARIEASDKILFIRLLNCDEGNDAMISLKDCINKRFPEKDINFLFVKRGEEEQNMTIAQNARALCFETVYKGIKSDISWIGNCGNWKKALSNIKASSREKTFLANLETLIAGGIIGRKVIIWGMNYLFAEIEQLLIDYNYSDYFAYDQSLSKNYASVSNILQDTSFLSEKDEDKPFVIVNTKGFHEEIFALLSAHNFTLKTDFYYY